MRKLVTSILISVVLLSALNAQTNGVLTVTTTTERTGLPGKNYAPRHCLAIWVEDSEGKFVKTLLVNAAKYRNMLSRWASTTAAAGSRFNSVDAVTGATNNTHGTRSCKWDGTDLKGNVMPDGTYKIVMEITDQDRPGRLAEFVFVKGKEPYDNKFDPKPGFESILLQWKVN